MDAELKPCPWCGQSNGRIVHRDDPFYAVVCWASGCGAEGPWKDNEAAAREAWNRRASTPAQAGAERTCERCGGSGDITVGDTSNGPDGDPYEVTCPDCEGTGVTPPTASLVPEEVREALACADRKGTTAAVGRTAHDMDKALRILARYIRSLPAPEAAPAAGEVEDALAWADLPVTTHKTDSDSESLKILADEVRRLRSQQPAPPVGGQEPHCHTCCCYGPPQTAEAQPAQRTEGWTVEALLAEFERRTNAVRVGAENSQRGSSVYNWRQAHLNELRAIVAAPPAPQTTGEHASPTPSAPPAAWKPWVVADGGSHGESRFRCMKQGMPAWTIDPEEALQFARRADAEAFAAEDEDAWRVIQISAPIPPAAPDAEVVRLRARLRWLFDHIDRTGLDPWKHQLRPPLVDETGNDWMMFDEFIAAIDKALAKDAAKPAEGEHEPEPHPLTLPECTCPTQGRSTACPVHGSAGR